MLFYILIFGQAESSIQLYDKYCRLSKYEKLIKSPGVSTRLVWVSPIIIAETERRRKKMLTIDSNFKSFLTYSLKLHCNTT